MYSCWHYQVSLVLMAIIHATTSVYYGTPARPGELKYSVLLNLLDGGCRPHCTGSLIDTRHILTAGHCVYKRAEVNFEAVAGVDWTFELETESRNVKTIHRHPGFRPSMRNPQLKVRCLLLYLGCELGQPQDRLYANNDIAVLTVDQDFVLSERVGVVSLPSYLAEPPYGSECEFSGWGDNEFDRLFLFSTKFQILNPAECSDIAMDTELCAKSINEVSHTGPGDSGGPLVCNGVVVGILHTGKGHEDLRATFPIVSQHMDFIQEALSD